MAGLFAFGWRDCLTTPIELPHSSGGLEPGWFCGSYGILRLRSGQAHEFGPLARWAFQHSAGGERVVGCPLSGVCCRLRLGGWGGLWGFGSLIAKGVKKPAL